MSNHSQVFANVYIVALVTHAFAAQTFAQEQLASPDSAVDSRQAFVTLIDGSQLKVELADEPIVIQTAHGRLSIPARDVRRIAFALRLSEEEQQKISECIEALDSSDLDAQQQAIDDLFALRSRAWLLLEKAASKGPPHVSRQAEALLDRIWESTPEAELVTSDLDVVETPDARIAGQIVGESVRIETAPFGGLVLKLRDAISLRSMALPEPEVLESLESKAAQADPGNLKSLENQVGNSYLFKVTGAGGGTMYGSNPYTTDSLLASAVVHCGYAKPGEAIVVKVTILGNLPSYIGSTMNGLSSHSYSTYPGYEINKPKKSRPRR